jgi:hypothetical protein
MPSWAIEAADIPTVNEPKECNSPEDFGELTFVINGKNFTFDPYEWVYGPDAKAVTPPRKPENRTKSDAKSDADAKSKNMMLLGQSENESTLVSIKHRLQYNLSQLKTYISSKVERVEESLSQEPKKKKCKGTFMAMDLQNEQFLVGDMFMRKYYSVFDRQNDRVGLAEAVVLPT